MAPGARNAGRLAEQVMEQDIGRAWRVGRGEIADDAVEGEQRLGQVSLEEAIEDVASALRRELVDDTDLVRLQADQIAAQAGKLRQPANARPGFRRRLQQPFADQRDDRV